MKKALKWLLFSIVALIAIVFIVQLVKVKAGKSPSTVTAKKVVREYELAMTDDSLAPNWSGQTLSCWSPMDKSHPGPDKTKWNYSLGTKTGSFDTLKELNAEIGEKYGMTYRVKRNMLIQAGIDTYDWFASFLE